MVASNEWEELHLTPAGWVDGSYRLDGGDRMDVDAPADAVLTVRRRVYVASLMSGADIDQDETPRTKDTARIAALRQQFGEPPFGV
ncbi:translation initiation factor 1 [Ralstonia pseudosolanacearum]|uniref:translation initiation factor 1 n=1 Tax=Ralstonia pseudosolanacearum TaxID=1310165 RepID=UPI001FF9AC6B|nr:translation initiation factor 1 [Ralstonia pseudosolanacearum]